MSATIEAMFANSAPSAVEADPAIEAGPVDGDSSFKGILSEMVEAETPDAPAEAESAATSDTDEPNDASTEAVVQACTTPVPIETGDVAVAIVSTTLDVAGEPRVTEETSTQAAPKLPTEAPVEAAAMQPQTTSQVEVATTLEPVVETPAETPEKSAGDVQPSTMPVREATTAQPSAEAVLVSTEATSAAETAVEAPTDVATPEAEAKPTEPVVPTEPVETPVVTVTSATVAEEPVLPMDDAPTPKQPPDTSFEPVAAGREDAPTVRPKRFAAPEAPGDEPVKEPQTPMSAASTTQTTVETPVVAETTTVTVETSGRDADARDGESRTPVELGPAAESVERGETSKPDAAAETPKLDMSRFVDRVVRFTRTMVGRDTSSLEMRLNPPELGSVRLAMTMKEGELRMTMQTTTEAARAVIAQHLDGLRTTLVQQGYDVARLEVSVGDSFIEQQAAQSDAQPRHFTRGQQQTMPGMDGETADAAPSVLSLYTSRYLDMVA